MSNIHVIIKFWKIARIFLMWNTKYIPTSLTKKNKHRTMIEEDKIALTRQSFDGLFHYNDQSYKTSDWTFPLKKNRNQDNTRFTPNHQEKLHNHSKSTEKKIARAPPQSPHYQDIYLPTTITKKHGLHPLNHPTAVFHMSRHPPKEELQQ